MIKKRLFMYAAGLALMMCLVAFASGCGSAENEVPAIEQEPSQEEEQEQTQDQQYGAIMEKVLEAYGNGDYEKASEYNGELPQNASDMPVSDEERAAYDQVYDELADEGMLHENYVFHCICDVDNDGRGEYLIQTGTCEADYMLLCYKYRDGKAEKIGEIGSGHSSVHQYPGHEGIILEYAHMGGEALTQVTFGDGEPGITQIGGRDQIPAGEDYFQLGLLFSPED